jgi:hypothetical protein
MTIGHQLSKGSVKNQLQIDYKGEQWISQVFDDPLGPDE